MTARDVATGPILSIEDLHIDFELDGETVHAVRGIDLEVRHGEILAIVGESGSGKSATALSILGLNPSPPVRYPSGAIRFDGHDLLGLSEPQLREVRGEQIAMIFQDPMTCLNPVTRIGAQVEEVCRLHRGGRRGSHRTAVLEALAAAGIPDPEQRARQYPHQLSGGLRQRAMIAMALVANPRLLIADEPTTALDVTVQAQILDVLDDLRRSRGMSILLITHDLGVVADVADRVLVMREGQVVERADVTRLFAEPQHPYTRRLLAATPRLGPRPPIQEGIA
jgi:ABC-type dipeptide/oligopeptide/nickel transport system ATPase component